MAVTIVAEQGSHLLITNGERYAVVERRDDHLYNCHDHTRAPAPVKDLSAVQAILDERDWTDRDSAQATFDGILERGSQLAERM